ncbi:MAG: hypothetical protein ACFB10_06480 [Salibacteraceae bacterium]
MVWLTLLDVGKPETTPVNLLEKMQLIERLDGLISRRCTGPPACLASRLNVSERNVYNLVKVMKEMGAPIFFCRYTNSYCYEEEVRFVFGFETISSG